MSFLLRHWRKMLAFLREELHDRLWMCSAAFGILMLFGVLLGVFFEDTATMLLSTFTAGSGESSFTFADLLTSNLRAGLVTIIYGMIPLLYLPALSLGLNAIQLGCYAALYVRGGMVGYFCAAIFSNGIGKIAALLLSIALGLHLCKVVSDYARYSTKGLLSTALKQIARVYLLLIVPLFALTSVVEYFVTPWIIRFI